MICRKSNQGKFFVLDFRFRMKKSFVGKNCNYDIKHGKKKLGFIIFGDWKLVLWKIM